jgi:nitroimidazol reductase NimA-like FMN-containing flavoprotein (pyridoxamine 5'-phosphate oxidase superfamily)
MEAFLDEGTSLVVNCIDERFGINFRFAFRDKAFYLLSSGSIQKKAQCVVAIV